jgi:hypothetical protein
MRRGIIASRLSVRRVNARGTTTLVMHARVRAYVLRGTRLPGRGRVLERAPEADVGLAHVLTPRHAVVGPAHGGGAVVTHGRTRVHDVASWHPRPGPDHVPPCTA